MRVVADTNVVVSGLLWHGNERRLLDAARDGFVELFTSKELLAELEDVLGRSKFAPRLIKHGLTVQFLVDEYAAFATLIQAASLAEQVSRDPDDDAVLACAVAAEAEFIVTGDDDLLVLVEYHGIEIVRTKDFNERFVF